MPFAARRRVLGEKDYGVHRKEAWDAVNFKRVRDVDAAPSPEYNPFGSCLCQAVQLLLLDILLLVISIRKCQALVHDGQCPCRRASRAFMQLHSHDPI